MADEPIIPADVEVADALPAREASVRLRDERTGQTAQDLLDPAQQSLADALRVTLRFVQLGMVGLLVLFFFSGLTTVREGEIGLKLWFGKITAEKLPGGHWAAPYPMGDFVKVETGTKQLVEDTGFWPFLTPNQRSQKIEDLGGSADLDPENDGALITADGNLVHTQWVIVYRRAPDQARKFAQNIHPELEEVVVRSAVRHAVVRAVSEVTIDDLLKEAGSGPGSVAARAEAIAQEMLDKIESGIVIEDLAMSQKMPPLAARDSFAAVQSAEANSQSEIDKARQEAARTLNEAAGGIHVALRDQILRYGEMVDVHSAALQGQDTDQIAQAQIAMDGVLTDIDALIESENAGGDVARMMLAARSYRLEERNRRESDARRFEAKLEQYRANPGVTIQLEWSEAWARLASNDFVEIMTHPIGGGPIWLQINRDPSIARRQEESIKSRLLIESERQRLLRQQQAEFKTTTELLKEG